MLRPLPSKAGPLLGSLGIHAAALGLAAVTGMSVTRLPDAGVGGGPTGGGEGTLAIVLSEPSATGSPLIDDTLAGDVRPELLEASFPEVVQEPVESAEPTTWLADATAAAESEVTAEPETRYPGVVVELERSPSLALAGMRAGSHGPRSHVHGDDARPVAQGSSGAPREGQGWSNALPWLGGVGQAGSGGGGGLGTGSGPGTGGGQGPAVSGPSLVEGPRPAYPRQSVRAEEEGTVVCRIHVAADGLVTSVEVVESSGHERLDRAATETIRTWRFEPKRVDGRSVATSIVHRVTFRLDRVG